MVKEGLINLDFADVRAVMREMGKAMMGTGEAAGEKRALTAAEAAISNPLIDDVSMKGAQGPADLDHRRQGPDALRGRRGGDPHPRGGRSGRQHHRRRDLRRKPRRHHPRLGGGDRHRPGRCATAVASAPEARLAELDAASCAPTTSGWPSASSAPSQRGAHASGGRCHRAPARRRLPAHAAIESAAKAAVAAAMLPATRSRRSPSGRCRRSRRCSSSRPPSGRPSRRTAGGLHPAAAGAAAPRAPRMPRHRRTADAGAERAARAARRAARATSIRKSAGWRCCSGWPRSVSAAASSEEPQAAARDAARATRVPRAAAAGSAPDAARRRVAPEPVSEYAKRPAPQGLDPHGRQAPVHNSGEDDQLDIPAFLRRQAN